MLVLYCENDLVECWYIIIVDICYLYVKVCEKYR